MSERSEWVWMPHAGHLIVSRDCRFHLNTCVGDYIVSTVGEYLPDAPVREILAYSRGITLRGKGDARLADYMKRIGYEEIGLDRTYETMVFVAKTDDAKCCPYTAASWENVDFAGYTDAAAAREGHLRLCEHWMHVPASTADVTTDAKI